MLRQLSELRSGSTYLSRDQEIFYICILVFEDGVMRMSEIERKKEYEEAGTQAVSPDRVLLCVKPLPPPLSKLHLLFHIHTFDWWRVVKIRIRRSERTRASGGDFKASRNVCSAFLGVCKVEYLGILACVVVGSAVLKSLFWETANANIKKRLKDDCSTGVVLWKGQVLTLVSQYEWDPWLSAAFYCNASLKKQRFERVRYSSL